MDFQAVVETAVRLIGGLLEGMCLLSLLSDDGNWLQPAALYHRDPDAKATWRGLLGARPLPAGEGLPGQVVKSGEGVLLARVAPEDLESLLGEEDRSHPAREAIHSLVLAPLHAQGRVIGLLTLAREHPGRPLTADDQRLLQDLADRASLALTSARLYAENLRRLETLTSIYALAQKLSHSLDLRRLVEDIVATCVTVFRAALAWIGRAEPDGSIRILSHAPRSSDYPLQLRLRWDDSPEGRGPTGQAIRSGFPQVIEDASASSAGDPQRERLLGAGYHSAAALPLISRNRPFGSLALYSTEPGFFTPERVELFLAYAHQAAAALENARLFAETERRLQYMSALRTVDMAIVSSLDLRVVLSVLLDQVTTHLAVDAADVLLLHPHSRTLEFAAGRGFRSRALRHTLLRLGQGYAGRAALERRIIEVEDLREAPDGLRRSPWLPEEEFRTYYAAPLIAKGEVKGVLEIFHRAAIAADPDWRDFLETLAGQAAVAIDNATLFEELQRANASLVEAYDATLEGWVRALDLRDQETEGHTRRVTELAVRLARAHGLSGEELVHIRRGALLHDIGKMAIPDAILLKPGPLTEQERAVIRQHPVYAFELLSAIPYLRPALAIPYCHHERWDGTGYPRGLQAEEIPLAARLFAVVDVWDALRSDRPYRRASSAEEAVRYLREEAGRQFDPRVVEAFLRLLEEDPLVAEAGGDGDEDAAG